MQLQAKTRCSIVILLSFLIIITTIFFLHLSPRDELLTHSHPSPDVKPPPDSSPPLGSSPTPDSDLPSASDPPSDTNSTSTIRYRPPADSRPPVTDNFPFAFDASSPSDLPPVPSWNAPPSPHVGRPTPLFIGFTRNWPVLQQAVVSYITAGWPASDLYVIENTGTMSSNRDGLLTLQNPFYLNYQRLTKVYGVNVVSTPTLLTFAQLQNFYIWLAGENDWDYYFWSHMDVIALSDEEYIDPETHEYQPLYKRMLSVLDKTLSPTYDAKWAIVFFAYDKLTLVNRHAYMDVGGWDTTIGYYMSDCDMHSRISMRGYKIEDAAVGLIYDVGNTFDDLMILYRRQPVSENLQTTTTTTNNDTPTSITISPSSYISSPSYISLRDACNSLQIRKNTDPGGRNTWQAAQQGGVNEPFHIDPEGFDRALWQRVEFGKTMYAEKWGHRGCDIREVGLKEGDAWRVEMEVEKDEAGE